MKQEREKLHQLCQVGLQEKGLSENPAYVERLRKELKELDAQGHWNYFLNIHNKFKAEKLIFPVNEFNNLIDFVLGLAPSVDITKPSAFVQGESPDIDIDYIKPVRDYMKRSWAAKIFGQQRICEIGTYGTSGIKSSLLDNARLYGCPKEEIQAITNKMVDKYTDDDGETRDMEWGDALKIYPEFQAYCERNPDVASAAETLLDRIRSGGVHAGGLVICSEDIDGFVPLEVRSVTKENPNGIICTAWTEGLNRQDLQPVGLIKFDLLVINNLMQIALACKLIKERHGLTSICALPDSWDWSDEAYLNDPLSLQMANKADLKGIFQFDSEGIRKLVKRSGVTQFDDLPALSALYRPGCLSMGMDVHYYRRKKWSLNPNDPDGEPFNIHPVMRASLEKTYGVLIFQEQIMDILTVVGEIPDMYTEKVRKAISKKKIKDFIEYKQIFIENGQRVLGVNEEYVIDLWNQIESFAEYGFNKSHSYAYAVISARLLWLKSHYPLEFYTSILQCENDVDKFKEYKLDASKHGIEIHPVHINKSKANFSICDKKIYFGFQNIKSIGEGVADRIVENQPYKDFSDFLDRFGTNATVIKALVSLGVFEEDHDRLTMRKFSELYKNKLSARKDRQKRFEITVEKKKEELKELLLEEVKEDDPDFSKMCDFTPEADQLWQDRFFGIIRHVPYQYKGEQRTREVTYIKQLQDLLKKRQTSIDNFNAKEAADDNNEWLTFDNANFNSVKIDPDEEKILKDQLVLPNTKTTYPMAESLYYGFQWVHRLETHPDYRGFTLDWFLDEFANNPEGDAAVEVQIKNVKRRESKPKGDRKPVEFYSIEVEDANGKCMFMNIWMDDYTRFQDELKTGNCVRMRVRPPGGGFNTLTFESVERHKRKNLPPKELDPRLVLLKFPEEAQPKFVDILDDMKFDSVILSAIE